jgi:hypothetical protein
VWTRQQVDLAARGGRVSALRFSDTEMFPTRLNYERLAELLENPKINKIQSPVKVPPEAFARIYREAKRVR